MKLLIRLNILLLSIILIFVIIININKRNIYPSSEEVKELKSFYGQEIKSESDIIKLQNYIIKSIIQSEIKEKKIDVLKILYAKKGLCYDRSLLMQKYFIINNFHIRPVYLFFGVNNTTPFEFFSPKLSSHSIFEIEYDNNWYVIRTNTKMNKLETIEEYLNSGYLPRHTRYIRYLSNRHGRFISPSFIPDIYFF